eukprot:4090255-Pleurochrysis_carterae.AAC.2
MDFLCALHFRQDDRVCTSCSNRARIIGAPGRRQVVDADSHLSRTIAVGTKHLANALSRDNFGVHSHRILTIEDQTIGWQSLSL